MTTVEHAELGATTALTAQRRRRWRPQPGSNWWRHVVALIACGFALFPIVYVVSAAFNEIPTLVGVSINPVPKHVALTNFRHVLATKQFDQTVATPHFAWWYLNSLFIPGVAAIFSVFMGALAAYAFSRFRFKGRRFGMLALLLIQMFPAFLSLVAIYLILSNVGEVFSFAGLNTRLGLILVYLGGAMGVNTWLMKGFFDTIPAELDESARVDGATPTQIFWGVILPLATPVLAVISLISFITALNEYVLASAILQTPEKYTLIVGLNGFVSDNYAKAWGPFAAGVVLTAIAPTALFFALQRFIVEGLTGGAVKG
jgi:arabinogalactan oligomer/maltooligosaccharide transport system permease protein